MRVEQVQNERDVIGKRQSSKRSSPDLVHSSDDPWERPDTLIDALLRSENTIQNLRDTVIKQTGNVEYSMRPEEPPAPLTGARSATINDIFKSLHSQLLLVIEWAKTLPPFLTLCTDDQTALLKNFASQHVVLCVAYRSKDAADFLKLINDSCIPRPSKNGREGRSFNVLFIPSVSLIFLIYFGFYLRDCERVMDQMVAPMRFMKMDDAEFVALKACVLFNPEYIAIPVAKGLSSQAVMNVLDTRRRIFSALEHYVKTRKSEENTRIGDLTFFMLSPLSSLANSVSEDILVTKLSGVARIDILMEELILADAEEQKCTQRNDIIPMHNCNLNTTTTAEAESSYNTYERPQTVEPSRPDSLTNEFDSFDPYPSTSMASYALGPLEGSRSNSPSSSISQSNLMWSSPLLACEPSHSPLYIPNGGF
uniref:NR LBD domain-containing protein n=1 Tax=Heterorhabditis bacteriophora TaxID=37862 RepID=A0A1I7XVJ1_HETBA